MPPTFGGPVKLDTSTDPQVGYRPPGPLDAAAALDPYDGRFTERNAAHLLRRAGFGGTPTEITALAALGMTGAVDSLIHPSGPDADFPALPDRIAAASPPSAPNTGGSTGCCAPAGRSSKKWRCSGTDILPPASARCPPS